MREGKTIRHRREKSVITKRGGSCVEGPPSGDCGCGVEDPPSGGWERAAMAENVLECN